MNPTSLRLALSLGLAISALPLHAEPQWIWTSKAAKDGEKATFRKTFNVSGKVRSAKLDFTCDNGATAWLNGTEIARRNAPSGLNPAFDAALTDYVAGFAEHYAGANFNPHVSTGVAPTDYLDAMIAEPFAAFTFAPAGAAIYQIGPFGTAARLLKQLEVAR